MDPTADSTTEPAVAVCDRTDAVQIARWIRRATLPFAVLAGIAFYVCFGVLRVPVGMDSMPTIPPGSLCIVDKRAGQARIGSEVFVDLPAGGTLLSRVAEIDAEDRLVVRNDRAQSRLPDSAHFGPLPRTAVRGVVLVVFAGTGESGEALRGR